MPNASNEVQPRPTYAWFWFFFRIFGLIAVILMFFAYFQRSLIYSPTQDASLSQSGNAHIDSIVNIQVITHDDLLLHGWLLPAHWQGSEKKIPLREHLVGSRPLVIIFPGNAGNRSYRTELIKTMRAFGADSLIFDYRGYGDNEGSPSEVNFVRDAHAIWDFVTQELKVPANRIVLYGESLGGGTATELARDLGKAGIEPGGLILQSTFNSLVDTGKYHFPILPVSLLLIDRFESEKHIKHVKCPILQLHGLLDTIVPVNLGKKLFEAAPAKSATGVPKQQVILLNANHNDVFDVDEVPAHNAIRQFLIDVQSRMPKEKLDPKPAAQ